MDLAAIGHDSYRDCISVFCRRNPAGHVERIGGLRIMATGASHRDFNNVVVDGEPQPDDFRAAVAILDDRDLPFTVALRSGEDDRHRAVVTKLGLGPSGPAVPIMVATRPSGIGWPQDIERTDGVVADEAHRRILVAGFGLPRGLIDEFLSPSVFDDPAFDLVVGAFGTEPVVTALGVTVDDVVGVYNVATVPAFRRRGLGAALTAAVVDRAFADGATAAALQTSEMGRRVYESLGFAVVGHQERWSRPE